MKKLFIISVLMFFVSGSLFSQQWTSSGSSIYYNSGKVGIGTSSPTNALSVKGRLDITTPIAGNYTHEQYHGNLVITKPRESAQYINIIRQGSWAWSIGMIYNTNTFAIGTGKQTDSEFLTPTFCITENQYVGIGKESPQYKLDVGNTSRFRNEIILENGYFTIRNTNKTSPNIGYDWKIHNMTGSYGNSLQFWVYDKTGAPNGYAQSRLVLMDNGNVGIGVSNPDVKLDVSGTIRAHELKVCLNKGCDFVFEPDYTLMPLEELGSFVKQNKHLPEVAPAAIMESEGINVSEMNAMLLQKVEELTLYILAQQEQISAIQSELKILKK